MRRVALLGIMVCVATALHAQSVTRRWSVAVPTTNGWSVSQYGRSVALLLDDGSVEIRTGTNGRVTDTIRNTTGYPITSLAYCGQRLFCVGQKEVSSAVFLRADGDTFAITPLRWPYGDPGLYPTVRISLFTLPRTGGLYASHYHAYHWYQKATAIHEERKEVIRIDTSTFTRTVMRGYLSVTAPTLSSDQRSMAYIGGSVIHRADTNWSLRHNSAPVVGSPVCVDVMDHAALNVSNGSTLIRLTSGSVIRSTPSTVLGPIAPLATVLAVRSDSTSRIVMIEDLWNGGNTPVDTLPGHGRLSPWIEVPAGFAYIHDPDHNMLHRYQVVGGGTVPDQIAITPTDTAITVAAPVVFTLRAYTARSDRRYELIADGKAYPCPTSVTMVSMRFFVPGTYPITLRQWSNNVLERDTIVASVHVRFPDGPTAIWSLDEKLPSRCHADSRHVLIVDHTHDRDAGEIMVYQYPQPLDPDRPYQVGRHYAGVTAVGGRSADDTLLGMTLEFSDNTYGYVQRIYRGDTAAPLRNKLAEVNLLRFHSYQEQDVRYGQQGQIRYHAPTRQWIIAHHRNYGEQLPGISYDMITAVDDTGRLERFETLRKEGWYATDLLDIDLDSSMKMLAVFQDRLIGFDVISRAAESVVPMAQGMLYTSACRIDDALIVSNIGIHRYQDDWEITYRFPFDDIIAIRRIGRTDRVLVVRRSPDTTAIVFDVSTTSALYTMHGSPGLPICLCTTSGGDTAYIGTEHRALAMYQLPDSVVTSVGRQSMLPASENPLRVRSASTGGPLVVTFNDTHVTAVWITDACGREVARYTGAGGRWTVDLPTGTYRCLATTPNAIHHVPVLVVR